MKRRQPFGSNPEERAIIEIIKLKSRTRRDGKKPGTYKIATELNQMGIPSPMGKARQDDGR